MRLRSPRRPCHHAKISEKEVKGGQEEKKNEGEQEISSDGLPIFGSPRPSTG